ncbi:hypothetical protein TSAR_011829, partial [Trichomalopsis sarcophagae]
VAIGVLSKLLVIKKDPVYVLDESSSVKAYKHQTVDGQLVDLDLVDKSQIQIVEEVCEEKSLKEDPMKGNYRRTWDCPHCSFSTLYGYSLRSHILNQHQTNRKKPAKAKKEPTIFECEMCGKKYKQFKFLKAHIKSFCGKASGDFRCEHCPFVTRRKYPNLYNHMKKHSEMLKKKTYKCSDCDKKFKLKSLLNKHNKKCGGKDWD